MLACVHTTLGSRLFCRSGIRVWVRTYTPGDGEKLQPRFLYLTGGLRRLDQVLPIVLVAKFFSSPSALTSLLCIIHPALFIWQDQRDECKSASSIVQRMIYDEDYKRLVISTRTFKDGYCFLKASANAHTFRVSDMSTIWMYTS